MNFHSQNYQYIRFSQRHVCIVYSRYDRILPLLKKSEFFGRIKLHEKKSRNIFFFYLRNLSRFLGNI